MLTAFDALAASPWSVLETQRMQPFQFEPHGLSPELSVQALQRIEHEKKQFAVSSRHFNVLQHRASYYAPYVLAKCRERGVPLEIALLPMVESVYDPFALSQDGAAGLWQLMPSTAIQLGVEINWWYDGRRDIEDSTDAALDYLTKMYKRFDDWALALAAYNAGPARISRLIKKNKKAGGSGNYWELDLPRETARYVPRLLALRELSLKIDSATVLDGELPFHFIELDHQIDLLQVAKFIDGDIEELYKLNAGLNRWATPAAGPHRIWVPSEKAAEFERKLAELKREDMISWSRYVIQPGDSLSKVAVKKRSRTDWISAANQLADAVIKENQALIIPRLGGGGGSDKLSKMPKAEVDALTERIKRMAETIRGQRRVRYTVVAGDSWWKVAKQFDTTIAKLTDWNKRSAEDLLRVGDKLTIWQTIKAFQRDDVFRTVYHTVRSGDTLSGLAVKHKVSVSRIKDWNSLHGKRYIKPGDVITMHVNVTQ